MRTSSRQPTKPPLAWLEVEKAEGDHWPKDSTPPGRNISLASLKNTLLDSKTPSCVNINRFTTPVVRLHTMVMWFHLFSCTTKSVATTRSPYTSSSLLESTMENVWPYCGVTGCGSYRS